MQLCFTQSTNVHALNQKSEEIQVQSILIYLQPEKLQISDPGGSD